MVFVIYNYRIPEVIGPVYVDWGTLILTQSLHVFFVTLLISNYYRYRSESLTLISSKSLRSFRSMYRNLLVISFVNYLKVTIRCII